MATGDDLTIYKNESEDNALKIVPGLDLPLVEDLPDPITLEELKNQERMQIISRMVSEIVRCSVVRDALEMVHRLRLVKTLKAIDTGAFRTYDRLMNLLRFVALYAQMPRVIQNLLSQGLVQALLAGIEVKDRLETLFKDEKNLGPDKEQRRSLIHALEGNQEWIGQKAIVNDEGKTVPPSVQNWLKVYNRSQPVYVERSKFNQINFLNSERLVQVLSPKEKKVLEGVLEIYDWLLFPPAIPKGIDEQKINEYINQQNLVLPKDFKLPKLPLDTARDLRPQDMEQKPIPPLPPEAVTPSRIEYGTGSNLGGERTLRPVVPPPVLPQVSKQPLPPSHPLPASPLLSTSLETGKGEEAKGKAREEWEPQSQIVKDDWYGAQQGKGLKLGQDMKYEIWNMNQGKQAMPPIPPRPVGQKPNVNIDQKLEELKKKVKKQNHES